MPEIYEIEDPRPRAAASPYTFFLPEMALIEAVDVGDSVKAIFRAVPSSEDYGAERMWVTVTSADGAWLEGVLDSEPRDMPNLKMGANIRLPRSHVISVIIRNPVRMPILKIKREYWDRCFVDQSVVDGELKAGYLHREVPDLAGPNDKYPDSGWRIRGDMRGVSSEELESRKVVYVALGLVLNSDDSWIHLIDEPVGSAFERDFETGVFARLTE